MATLLAMQKQAAAMPAAPQFGQHMGQPFAITQKGVNWGSRPPPPQQPTTMERQVKYLVSKGMPEQTAVKLRSGAYKSFSSFAGTVVVDLSTGQEVGTLDPGGKWTPAKKTGSADPLGLR